MPSREQLTQTLEKYLPQGTSSIISDWIVSDNVNFKISRPRKTKLGDYRHPWKKDGHRISVNGNLNPYSFLVTTVHEFAHLKTWKSHKNKVKPHGIQWKEEFKELMCAFDSNIFPEEIQKAVDQYMANPKASSCTDVNLMNALRAFDDDNQTVVYLQDVPLNTVFTINNRRKFIKIEKLRKRFKCRDLANNRFYLVSPLAEIEIVD